MRDTHTIRVRALHLFWNRETFRQLQVGIAAWVACGLAVSWLFGKQHVGLLPSWPSLALAAGFGLGAFAIVTYGGLRFLLAPRRLAALLGAGTLFALPVALGLLIPALFGWRAAGFDAAALPVLGAGLLLLLTACLVFALGRCPHREQPRPRDLAPVLVLMALAISLVAWQSHAASSAQPLPAPGLEKVPTANVLQISSLQR